MRIVALALSTALLLSGCEQSQTSAPKPPTAKWVDAPEKSFALLLQHVPPLDGEEMTRCWKNTDGFDCLKISHMSEPEISFERFSSKTLSDSAPSSNSGYGCAYYDAGAMTTETIAGKGPPLVTNSRIPLAEKPAWSRSYVKGFMRDNKIVETNRYFPCDKVVAILKNGSLQSFMTTAIKYADLGK